MIETDLPVFGQEVMDSLKFLAQKNTFLEMDWFLRQGLYFGKTERLKRWRTEVAVLGSGVPDELVYSFTRQPFWALGGSLSTAHCADALVPRDTDPMSRSALGFLLNPAFDLASDALVIVPAVSDSARKLAYLLKSRLKKVITVDYPPEKSAAGALEKYNAQMDRLIAQMEDHTGIRLTRALLARTAGMIGGVRSQMRSFLARTQGMEHVFPASLRMFVLYSYYFAEDLPVWAGHLMRLEYEIARRMRQKYIPDDGRPRVLLMGSPICFPNYKVPFLIEDVGMHIAEAFDPITQKAAIGAAQGKAPLSLGGLVRQVAAAQYQNDCSGAYTSNETLYSGVANAVARGGVEGVVYHILKGQVEYDFELSRFETLFEEMSIPVFRLETDYPYQDVEQLRVRMEAFREMLTQNRYGRERMAR